MSEQHYAIVFTKDFKPGEHWTDHLPKRKPSEKHVHGKHRADEDDSDRKQHWKAGDLYSVGTVVAASLPAHLEAIPLATAPAPDDVWDAQAKAFVKRAPVAIADEHRALAETLRAAGWTVTPPQ